VETPQLAQVALNTLPILKWRMGNHWFREWERVPGQKTPLKCSTVSRTIGCLKEKIFRNGLMLNRKVGVIQICLSLCLWNHKIIESRECLSAPPG